MEVGGRWDEAAYEFLLELARGSAEEAPRLLRGSATRSYLRRWVSLLSKTGMDSLASTLVYGTAENTEHWIGAAPTLGMVLCQSAETTQCSRMGLR